MKQELLEISISTNKPNIDFLLRSIENSNLHNKDKILFTIIWQRKPSADFLKENVYYKDNIRIITYNEVGLSRSRNRAIENALGDILLFSDDDIIFHKDIYRRIVKAYEELPEADLITFKALVGNNKPFKRYFSKARKHSILTAMKVSSWEITIKKRALEKYLLRFDENFGLGSRFPTAEENLFIIDAIRKGANVFFYPSFIVTHPTQETSSHYFDESLIKAKGAFFYRVFSRKAYIYSFIFALKKWRFSSFSFFDFFKLMIKGINEFRDLK